MVRLGRRAYGPVLALQRRLVEELRAGVGPDRLLIVEHDPVITLGRRADPNDVLVDAEHLAQRGIERFDVDRGGEVTYHGPGQLVAYPILDLRRYRRDVRWYSRTLLQTVAGALRTFGIEADLREGAETGLWVPGPGGGAKIGALGVRIQGWVSSHGVSLNVDPDLSHFDLIVPCGLTSRPVTSVREQLGWSPAMSVVSRVVEDEFAARFDVILAQSAESLEELLRAATPDDEAPGPNHPPQVAADESSGMPRSRLVSGSRAALLAVAAVLGARMASPVEASQSWAHRLEISAGGNVVGSLVAQTGPPGALQVATPQPTQPVDWPDLPELEDVEPLVRTRHFHVYAADDQDEVLRSAARRWAEHMDAVGVLIASRLGLASPPADPVRVMFARAYSAPCPARGLAMHTSDRSTVAVFIDETTSDVQVRAVVAHEITHAYTFGGSFVGDGVLTEGVANWAPGGLVRAWQGVPTWSDAVRDLLASGEYVSVADPAGLQPAPGEDCIGRRDRVYNARAAFTEWFVKRVGLDTVLAMPFQDIHEAREGSDEPVRRRVPDYDAAAGFTLEQLETIWLAEITGSL